jgi:ABC-type transport system involved in cytochrome bd biosynthesis fused ATPase/permease subunit
MQIIDFLVGAVLALVRFFLRLLGLMLALALALFILVFILIWTLLGLLSGRKPTVNVRAHFSRVRSFTDLGQAVNRRRSWSTDETVAAQPLLRRQSGDVQDVQARDLPPERGPDGR